MTNCNLCGLPTPTPPIQTNGHEFCCHGCSAVYSSFGKKIFDSKKTLPTPKQATTQPTGSEAFLRIEGMHCSSCEILIQHSAEKLDGILAVSTSYATSTAKVIYDPDLIDKAKLPEALSLSGYRAHFHSDKLSTKNDDISLLWFVLSVGLAGMVMMLNLAFFYPVDLGLVTLQELQPVSWLAFNAVPKVMFVLTTILIFVVGFPILRGAWIGLRTHMLNMDNLLAIAILAAYGFSFGQLLSGKLNFYFDVAAVIVAVVTVGRYYEREAKKNATRELSKIIETWAPSTRVIRNGELVTLGADEIQPGDLLLIRENEHIPVDGTIVSGESAVDESLMTGEPFPVIRVSGDSVLGGTHVVEGNLKIEVGSTVESQLKNLASILWSVQSSTPGTFGVADRIASIFVPLVLVLAALVSGWMLWIGLQPSSALLAGLTTLIVSCPCTFGLAVPLTTANAISTALRHGIIISSADIFEKSAAFETVALDKTGTLTLGEMGVEKVVGVKEVAEYAAAVERFSSHPIAEAIAKLASNKTGVDFLVHPGKGAEASVDGLRVAVGSKSLFALLSWEVDDQVKPTLSKLSNASGVVSYVGWNGSIYGAIITSDQRRPEWEQVVTRLQENKRVVLLTGAEHPDGYEDQVDDFHAGVPPEAKAVVVRQLKTSASVVMIGDGNNDAPALAEADLGIAFGVPTSLAAEAADVIIPGDRLDRIFIAFELIETTRKRIRQNIGWAFLYNAFAIPLALTGQLNPLFAALAMATSSFLVVWNSSRALTKANSDFLQIEELKINPKVFSRLGSAS
ncbi:MAG: heavy metal translocating P-type ATPase [SAR324 cluster bacterium]|nr:heavy metal translocating P-type ATPase [SAR324 cluster bacterium]